MWRNPSLAALLAIVLVACGGGRNAENSGTVATFGRETVAGGLIRLAAQGGPNPSPLTITLRNDGDCALSYTASVVTVDGKPWASVLPAGGNLAARSSTTLSVSIDVIATALTPATYTGTITITGTCVKSGEPAFGSPLAIAVNLTVTPVEVADTIAPTNTTGANFINHGAASTTSTAGTLDLAATDDTGIVGYYAAENPAPPLASATGWTAIAPMLSYSASVPFTLSGGAGPKTVYVWFKDAAGNVSTAASDRIDLLAPSVHLPKTGQIGCYDTAGNVIACAGTGQDGDLQAGVAWPSPRFTIDATGDCVTDNLTGLIWVKSPDSTTRTWQQALDHANGLTLCGFADWRLPNRRELRSLIDHSRINPALPSGHPFGNVQSSNYWSSTTFIDFQAEFVNLTEGYVSPDYKSGTWYAWPVRAGGGAPAELPKTGQTTCHDSAGNLVSCAGTGQDGDIQAGVAWPSPRFVVDGTGDCVTDKLTNLMWTKDADLPGSGAMSWTQALGYANNLTLCGFSDWRLPNIAELESLIDAEPVEPALPSGHPFINVRLGFGALYWSSTTYINVFFPTVFNNAWFITLGDGSTGATFKGSSSASRYVWPVRGGP